MNSEHGTDRLSLFGKTIVVTRREEQAKEFSNLLEQYGASVILFPAVEIVDPPSWNECDAAIEHLNNYFGIIFTSRNAVNYFFKRIEHLGRKENVKHCLLYAVGEKTQDTIAEFGFLTEQLPEHFSAEELAKSLVKNPVKGKKFLFPKGNLARNEIVSILTQNGAIVNDVVVYQTQEPEINNKRRDHIVMIKDCADMITFFSPSSVVHFLRSVPIDDIRKKSIAVFGRTTSDAAEQAGLPIAVKAPHSNINSFVDSIQKFYTETESEHAITK